MRCEQTKVMLPDDTKILFVADSIPMTVLLESLADLETLPAKAEEPEYVETHKGKRIAQYKSERYRARSRGPR